MADQVETPMADEMEQVPVDDWAAAFAALEPKDEKDTEADAGSAGAGTDVEAGDDVSDSEDHDEGEGPAEDEAGDGSVSQDVPGGPGDIAGADGTEDARFDWDDIDVSESAIEDFRKKFESEIRERVLNDVANAYMKQGARSSNGQLGASINDPDVCKRDRDGVPRFYNPETGREFTGDNPRRQAQEWVDDYNRELADAFNRTCADYSKKLMEQEGGRLAVVEFAPKYRALDPIRQSMLESIIEDYEIKDRNGDVIGYSCDLNKVLTAVNRQVAAIQRQHSRQQKSVAQAKQPTGPALDTPSVGSGGKQEGGKPQFKSIEEAMEWEQDQILAKMRGKK